MKLAHTGFQFIFNLVLKSPILSKFDVTAIFLERNTVNNAPLTMKYVKLKKNPNTLHENDPLPPAPNVCVPEVFNYIYRFHKSCYLVKQYVTDFSIGSINCVRHFPQT
jgi:hypothetical protein